MTEPVEIYRLELRFGHQLSSYPEIRFYSSKESFEEDLLRCAIEAKSRHFNSKRNDRTWLKFRWWNSFVFNRSDEDTQVSKVLIAEKLVDGMWTKLNYTLYPPRLEYSEDLAG